MRRSVLKTVLLIFAVLFTGVLNSYAGQAYKATLANLPIYAETMENGILVDLVKAMAKESGNDIGIAVDPFARSINNVQVGKADFHMPLIAVPNIDQASLEYDYSTETIFHVNFVMYTKKGSHMTREKLATSKVETDIAHIPYFDFKIEGSANPEQSLKKVNAGRIDAFVFADFAMDPLIKKNNLTQIQRELYHIYEVKIILPKGGRGGATDTFLSETIGKLRSKGEYEKIMALALMPYDNWQP